MIVRAPAGPVWTPVMGAEVLFAPIDRAMLRAARRQAVDGMDLGAGVEPDLEDMGDAFSLALITAGARDWRGVWQMAGPDDQGAGEELPFTAGNLAAALSDPITFEAFDAAYVRPFVLLERERAAPGNGSAASPNGNGEAAIGGQIIAASPAAGSGDAPNARTGSTKPKRTRKRTSGQS